ncbi:hypothetical protein FVE85_7979 [Porphyridium purpureum]|uniref:Uncharacterized protein n=1 Tax=Porphyridium purpureum TaxID=35688 RepID=A0A5J4YNA2_PORPP|nr:hypothetical protein FVE85_7979 [Porphyridium purpureum]|eukprot:POR9621..scf295_9
MIQCEMDTMDADFAFTGTPRALGAFPPRNQLAPVNACAQCHTPGALRIPPAFGAVPSLPTAPAAVCARRIGSNAGSTIRERWVLRAKREDDNEFREREAREQPLGTGDGLQPRFQVNVDDALATKTSFVKKKETKRILTVNDRLEQEIRDTAARLGVEQETGSSAEKSTRSASTPIDLSTIDPAQALLGSFGSGIMFVISWTLTSNIMGYFEERPNVFGSDVYVVTRLSAVLRTVVLTTFSLGSGLTFCTTVGLFLLAVKTFSLRVAPKRE